MHDHPHTIASKEAERQQLAALLNRHVDGGGAIQVLKPFQPVPAPPRRKRIDPETVLQRQRRVPKSDAVASPQQPGGQAVTAAMLAKLAAEGSSLLAATRELGITIAVARGMAERHGIQFTKTNMPSIEDEELVTLAREYARQGETLNTTSRMLHCGSDRLRRLADQHGITFRRGRQRA